MLSEGKGVVRAKLFGAANVGRDQQRAGLEGLHVPGELLVDIEHALVVGVNLVAQVPAGEGVAVANRLLVMPMG